MSTAEREPENDCTHSDERGSTVAQVTGDRYECIVCGTRFRLVTQAVISAGYTKDGLSYREGFAEGWAAAAKVISEHDLHEAEMCGADCIVLGLATFDDEESKP